MKKWLVVFGVLLLFLLLGLGYIYQFGGLGNYLLAQREINRLDGDKKVTALLNFGGATGENGYRGMLGYVNNKKYPGGVWVWGLQTGSSRRPRRCFVSRPCPEDQRGNKLKWTNFDEKGINFHELWKIPLLVLL